MKFAFGSRGRRGRHLLLRRPVAISRLNFDDLLDEISDHWQDKARSLQARRWRKIKNQLS